jgi:TetR/AcrR family fatty acid metabolism transcriptional regulator
MLGEMSKLEEALEPTGINYIGSARASKQAIDKCFGPLEILDRDKRNVMSRQKGKRGSRLAAKARTGSAKTREQIIGVAIEVFGTRGFHGTKVSDIVSRAGLTQPAFYFYFPSKQAIYDYLIQRAHDELLSTIRAARVPPDLDRANVPDMVRAAIEAFLQYFVDNRLLATIGYFQSPISAAIRDEIISVLSSHIAYEQGAGYFRRSPDPIFIAECYGGTLERVIQRYLFTGRTSARELATGVADILLHGILADSAKPETNFKNDSKSL